MESLETFKGIRLIEVIKKKQEKERRINMNIERVVTTKSPKKEQHPVASPRRNRNKAM